LGWYRTKAMTRPPRQSDELQSRFDNERAVAADWILPVPI
jgi:hypothetical protein